MITPTTFSILAGSFLLLLWVINLKWPCLFGHHAWLFSIDRKDRRVQLVCADCHKKSAGWKIEKPSEVKV